MFWLRRILQRFLPTDTNGHEQGMKEAVEARTEAQERMVRRELLKREIQPMLARMRHGK